MFLCYDFGKKPVIMYDFKKKKKKKPPPHYTSWSRGSRSADDKTVFY